MTVPFNRNLSKISKYKDLKILTTEDVAFESDNDTGGEWDIRYDNEEN